MNTTTRQPLGARFTRLWSAATVSFLGDGVMLAAFPLAAAKLTDNAMLIAGTQIARGLPWLCFGLFGGALVDRIDRRVAMISVDLIRAVAVATLFFAVWNGSATIALIWIIAFVLGTGEVVFDPASQALVPNVVSTDDLQRASGRLIASESVAKELAGPAVGGLLFALARSSPVCEAATGPPGPMQRRPFVPISPKVGLSCEATGSCSRWRHLVRSATSRPLRSKPRSCCSRSRHCISATRASACCWLPRRSVVSPRL
jgi:MFS family permease